MLKYTGHSKHWMNFKALAAVAAATPLMVACGSAEKTSFKLNGAGATFPAPLTMHTDLLLKKLATK